MKRKKEIFTIKTIKKKQEEILKKAKNLRNDNDDLCFSFYFILKKKINK